MSLDIITIILSMAVFFIAFYSNAKTTNLSLNSPSSMNEYFSGIFFLRKSSYSLLFGRIALLIGFPVSYILKFINDGTVFFYLPLILTTWLIALYFFKYASHFNDETDVQKGFFSILLKGKTYGLAGFLLWLIRFLYLTSVIYVFFRQ